MQLMRMSCKKSFHLVLSATGIAHSGLRTWGEFTPSLGAEEWDTQVGTPPHGSVGNAGRHKTRGLRAEWRPALLPEAETGERGWAMAEGKLSPSHHSAGLGPRDG